MVAPTSTARISRRRLNAALWTRYAPLPSKPCAGDGMDCTARLEEPRSYISEQHNPRLLCQPTRAAHSQMYVLACGHRTASCGVTAATKSAP
eukprot:scaffold3700_cov387-Prasinococcus_capsulatus_cf.AAC.9